MKSKHLLAARFVIFTTTALLAFTLRAQTPRYVVIDLGTLGGESYGAAINNAGQVAGQSLTTNGVTHAVLFSVGSPPQDLGTLGGDQSFARGINDAGQVAGSALIASSVYHAALFSAGSAPQDLGTLGGYFSYGGARRGIVCGHAYRTLEPRIAPGVFFNIADVDGDLVTISISDGEPPSATNPGDAIFDFSPDGPFVLLGGGRVRRVELQGNPRRKGSLLEIRSLQQHFSNVRSNLLEAFFRQWLTRLTAPSVGSRVNGVS